MSVITDRPMPAPTSGYDLDSKEITSLSRKRKLSQVETSEKNIFITQSLSSSESFQFSPVAILPRSCVPLTWLNTNSTLGGPGLGYVFESQIEVVKKWDQNVLVARLCPNGGLNVIERASGDAYISCPLHSWVTEQWCREAIGGKVNKPDIQQLLSKHKGHTRTASTSSASGARLPTPCSPKLPKNRKGALARMSILIAKESPTLIDEVSILVEPDTQCLSPEMALPAVPLVGLGCSIEDQCPPESQEPVQFSKNTVSNQLTPSIPQADDSNLFPRQDNISAEQVRKCYFETLYLSKTSLAFYAKGPLNRARAQLRSLEIIPTSAQDLNDLYCQLVLPTKKVDIKYKEGLRTFIQQLRLGEDNAENQAKTKKRKSRKLKLNKDGLWTDEDGYISQWWQNRELVSSAGPSRESQDEELRNLISDLRMRETEMQLLLILEVMRLEKVASRLPTTKLPKHPDIKAESVEDNPATVLANMPQHKKRDLSSELDTIVDRLCIWHTVGNDLLDSSSVGSTEHAKSKDRLRDFCANIIIPFYAPKLPEQCKSISRKLGGPDLSPQRPKTVSKPARLPGTIVKSRPQSSTKRTLARVLSEDHSMRHYSPPLLSRSSTAPMVPNLKREPSDTSHRPMSRGGMHKSVSFGNREIDLVADARVHEAKRRKMDKLAVQKRELDAAIDALKKPNRSIVAKVFMDEVEQRGSKQQVHIAATPRKGRIKAMTLDEPGLPVPPITIDHEPVIPSSTVKPISSMFSQSSATRRAVLAAIHDTPSRDRYKDTNSLSVPNLASCSTLTPTKNNASFRISATPSTSRFRNDMLQEPSHSPDDGRISTTPLQIETSQRPNLFASYQKRNVGVEQTFRDIPEIPAIVGQAMDRVMGGKCTEPSKGFDIEQSSENIYDQLGWNDDIDL